MTSSIKADRIRDDVRDTKKSNIDKTYFAPIYIHKKVDTVKLFVL